MKRAARSIVAMLGAAVVLAWLIAGCAASTRAQTINATFAVLNTSAAALAAFDAKTQQDIVADAKDLESGKAALTAWRAKRDRIVQELIASYQAVGAAAAANDEPSVATMLGVVAQFKQFLTAIGVQL